MTFTQAAARLGLVAVLAGGTSALAQSKRPGEYDPTSTRSTGDSFTDYQNKRAADAREERRRSFERDAERRKLMEGIQESLNKAPASAAPAPAEAIPEAMDDGVGYTEDGGESADDAAYADEDIAAGDEDAGDAEDDAAYADEEEEEGEDDDRSALADEDELEDAEFDAADDDEEEEDE